MASKRKPKALHAEASYDVTATIVKATIIVEKEQEEANPKHEQHHHHRKKHQLKSSTNKKDECQGTTTLNGPDEENARRFLSAQGWSEGMQESLIKSCKKMAIRYIITDDSGSVSNSLAVICMIVMVGEGWPSYVLKLICTCITIHSLTHSLTHSLNAADDDE